MLEGFFSPLRNAYETTRIVSSVPLVASARRKTAVAGVAALYWSVGRILEGWSSAGHRVVSALPQTAASRLVEWGKTWPSDARTGNVTASSYARSTAFLWLFFAVAPCSRKNRTLRLHRRETGRPSKLLTHPSFGFFFLRNLLRRYIRIH